MKYVLLVALLCLGLSAHAQINGKMTIAYTAPTLACDDTGKLCEPIPATGPNAIQAYNVWISESPIPDDFGGPPTVVVTGSTTTVNYERQVPNGTTLYVRVKAITTRPSKFSNQASKLFFVDLTPNAPTSVTLTFQIVPAQ